MFSRSKWTHKELLSFEGGSFLDILEVVRIGVTL